MKKVELKDADKVSKVRHFDISSITPIGHPLELSNGTKVSFMLGGLKVNAFKSAKAGKHGRYVPFSIEKEKETIWAFADEKVGDVKKIAFLLTHDKGFHLISIISGDKVLKVVPLDDLEKGHVIQTTSGRQITGGRSVLELFHIKGDVADSLNFVRHVSALEEKLMAAHKESFKVEKSDKAAEKERRRQAILARPKISGFREDGKKITAIPVVENEWQCLPNETGVILVSKFDGTAKGMIEAFFVGKKGSSCYKVLPCFVSEKPVAAKKDAEAPLEITEEIFSFGGRVDAFQTVSGKTLDLLRQRGVNCGSQFAVRYESNPDQPVLVALRGNEVVTCGNLLAVA